jgi:hypothetical protein
MPLTAKSLTPVPFFDCANIRQRIEFFQAMDEMCQFVVGRLTSELTDQDEIPIVLGVFTGSVIDADNLMELESEFLQFCHALSRQAKFNVDGNASIYHG